MSDKEQEMDEKLYGWYSAKHDQIRGHAIYRTPGGTEVVATAVYRGPTAASYHWDDRVCVGEVTTWVSSVNPKMT